MNYCKTAYIILYGLAKPLPDKDFLGCRYLLLGLSHSQRIVISEMSFLHARALVRLVSSSGFKKTKGSPSSKGKNWTGECLE